MSPRLVSSIALLLALVALAVGLPGEVQAAAGGGGGGGGGGGFSGGNRARDSAEERADRDYKRGLRERDSAWEHETKAKKANSEKKRAKSLAKARKDWRDAARHFRSAIEEYEEHYQAHASLGYALRKLGDYDASVAAYDRALEIKPAYAEAIEYRGEAYLGLGRVKDAARSYRRLVQLDPEKADLLWSAMESWLATATDDASADPAKQEWLQRFVEREREKRTRHQEAAARTDRW